ncbi:hypothetical protein VD0002_g9983 [Verticillium dahliae]|uniref:Uncharacterized protein n=1 Tax=Verticillium dahliae (strain VdLs.17 / ATCC MYA-4575 / FGSC 10137) TaxID=498257 RepID=G2XD84_VERDV|nr:uncharacterized protein VDAG_08116 [Verticillium dahliae VdLs.17]EGY16952.1 hypothetical protein VDAG_08116 [Verticillium dahliae VdLs.17]KAH6696174.1 hypothetical protein EV126DRAFT_69304 [Verticillium dahliae]PNH40672.1 hypothetical protein VD0003_g10068 [Verticillium dahliae]PNH54538.1 hypothetical protein VD0002_g9983 [Verticillium dahliae]
MSLSLLSAASSLPGLGRGLTVLKTDAALWPPCDRDLRYPRRVEALLGLHGPPTIASVFAANDHQWSKLGPANGADFRRDRCSLFNIHYECTGKKRHFNSSYIGLDRAHEKAVNGEMAFEFSLGPPSPYSFSVASPLLERPLSEP